MERAQDYPKNPSGAKVCNASESLFIVSISSLFVLNDNDPLRYFATELSMRDYLLSTGPLTTVVDASNWAFYNGQGIFMNCPQIPHLNHAVQIVGVNLEDPWNSYWIVRTHSIPLALLAPLIYTAHLPNSFLTSSRLNFTDPDHTLKLNLLVGWLLSRCAVRGVRTSVPAGTSTSPI